MGARRALTCSAARRTRSVVPHSPNLVTFAVVQPLILLVAWLMGLGAQRFLRRRAPLSVSTTTVASVLGT